MLARMIRATRSAVEQGRMLASPSPAGGLQLVRAWRKVRRAYGLHPTVEIRLGRFIATGPSLEMLEVFSEVFVQKIYDVELSEASPVVLDCGANTGLASLYFKLKWPGARITAFEPNPALRTYLDANLRGNGLTDVRLVHAACGLEKGSIDLYIPRGHSTAASTVKEWPGPGAAVRVDVVRLSDFVVEPVDLLKVDVEGAEWEIVRDLATSGKAQLIRRAVFEYHHRMQPEWRLSEFLRLLEDSGFSTNLLAIRRARERFDPKWQSVIVYAWRPAP